MNIADSPPPFRKISFAAFFLLSIFLLPTYLSLMTDTVSSSQPSETRFTVTVVPSSVVLKVGETAKINVTATYAGTAPSGRVCFGLEGFPNSGFRTSLLPECTTLQSGKITVTLTVEATPAAAPQTVNALVIARSEGQTAQVNLDVTVEPAFPPWITWAGLLLFFSVLGMVIMGKPKLPFKKTKTRLSIQ